MSLNICKIVALIWTSFVIILSGIPSKAIPKTFLNEIFSIDKIGHITFYFIMVLLWSPIMKPLFGICKGLALSFILCTSIGLMMEIYQKVYFEDRSFEWLDALANVVGAILGVVLFPRFEKLFPIFANPTRQQ